MSAILCWLRWHDTTRKIVAKPFICACLFMHTPAYISVRGTYYGRSTASLLYEMSLQLSKDSNELLWSPFPPTFYSSPPSSKTQISLITRRLSCTPPMLTQLFPLAGNNPTPCPGTLLLEWLTSSSTTASQETSTPLAFQSPQTRSTDTIKV